MKTNNFIVTTANAIFTEITEGMKNFATENKAMLESIKNDDFETGFNKIETLVQGVALNMKGVAVDGVGLPDFLHSISVSEDDLSEVTITVKSKLRAKNRVKEVRTIALDENFFDNATDLFINTLFTMYYNEFADENVQALNENIKKITEEENLPFLLQFEVSNSGGRVLYIDDKKVILKAQVEEAMQLSSYGLAIEVTDETDDYDKIVAEEVRNEFVSAMRTVNITPEILKKKIGIVEKLADLHTKKHSNKLIREGYHKKVENLKDAKSGVGYFSEKVEINGVQADVFALLKKNDKGEFEIVLSPYDANTNTKVDFDVLSAVK